MVTPWSIIFVTTINRNDEGRGQWPPPATEYRPGFNYMYEPSVMAN